MNRAAEERLPRSVGGLTDLALAAYAAHFPLFAALAAFTFGVQAAAEWLSRGDAGAQTASSIVGDALLVAAVAIGVARRVAVQPDDAPPPPLLSGALSRWFSAGGALVLSWLIYYVTAPAAGFVRPDTPVTAVLTVLSAPAAWLLWGAIGLAAPLASILNDPPERAIFTGFARAVFVSLRVRNLGRLAVLAFATVVPALLQTVLTDVLMQRHVAHAAFWGNVPADAIVSGPLVALQTVFALDFMRRTGDAARS